MLGAVAAAVPRPRDAQRPLQDANEHVAKFLRAAAPVLAARAEQTAKEWGGGGHAAVQSAQSAAAGAADAAQQLQQHQRDLLVLQRRREWQDWALARQLYQQWALTDTRAVEQALAKLERTLTPDGSGEAAHVAGG